MSESQPKYDYKKKQQPEEMLMGRVPPQATDIEEAVIGAIMLEREVLENVIDIIPASDYFYKQEHRSIYEAIIQLFNRGSSVDLLTVSEHLRELGTIEQIGGAYGLTQITMSVVSSAHIVNHARIVVEKYILRKIIEISGEAISAAYRDEDCFDLQDRTAKEISEIYEISGASVEHISKPIMRSLTAIQQAANSYSNTLGFPSNIKALDEITNGFKTKRLIIIAARPAQGKSSLAGCLALNLLKQNIPVCFVSLEMDKDELSMRMLASESSIDLTELQHGRVQNFDRLNDIASKIAALPLYFEDKPTISILGIKSLLRNLKRKNDIKVVFIDYIGLIKGNRKMNKQRAEEVSEFARELKMLAKDMDLCVICLAQVSRSAEATPNQKPKLSMLKESGGIEENADQVIFIHHQEGTELVVAKNRDGKIGEAKVKFIPSLQKWVDIYDNSGQQFESYKLPNQGNNLIYDQPF